MKYLCLAYEAEAMFQAMPPAEHSTGPHRGAPDRGIPSQRSPILGGAIHADNSNNRAVSLV